MDLDFEILNFDFLDPRFPGAKFRDFQVLRSPNFQIFRSPDFQNLAWARPGLGLGPGRPSGGSSGRPWALGLGPGAQLVGIQKPQAIITFEGCQPFNKYKCYIGWHVAWSAAGTPCGHRLCVTAKDFYWSGGAQMWGL